MMMLSCDLVTPRAITGVLRKVSPYLYYVREDLVKKSESKGTGADELQQNMGILSTLRWPIYNNCIDTRT